MIHSVEIAFLFMSFKRLRLEREQITQILLDLERLKEKRKNKEVKEKRRLLRNITGEIFQNLCSLGLSKIC